jgi:hypothetical protein
MMPNEPTGKSRTDSHSETTAGSRTVFAMRSPREELEAYARRRMESQRRADPTEAQRIEIALERAIELLSEAEEEVDDDLA